MMNALLVYWSALVTLSNCVRFCSNSTEQCLPSKPLWEEMRRKEKSGFKAWLQSLETLNSKGQALTALGGCYTSLRANGAARQRAQSSVSHTGHEVHLVRYSIAQSLHINTSSLVATHQLMILIVQPSPDSSAAAVSWRNFSASRQKSNC